MTCQSDIGNTLQLRLLGHQSCHTDICSPAEQEQAWAEEMSEPKQEGTELQSISQPDQRRLQLTPRWDRADGAKVFLSCLMPKLPDRTERQLMLMQQAHLMSKGSGHHHGQYLLARAGLQQEARLDSASIQKSSGCIGGNCMLELKHPCCLTCL